MIDNTCIFYWKNNRDLTSNNRVCKVFPDYTEIDSFDLDEQTVIFKMKSTQIKGNKGIIEFNHIFDNKIGISFIGTMPLLQFNEGSYKYWKENLAYFDGNFHTYAFTFNRVSGARMFFDGQEVPEEVTVDMQPPKSLGLYCFGKTFYGKLEGEISEVGIYNRQLTAQEIRRIK